MKTQSVTPAGSPPVQPLSKEDLALKKACGEFEALFTTQLLQRMRATVPKSEFFGSSEKEEIFRCMLDEETAKEIAKTGAMGIGRMLYAQLSSQRAAKVSTDGVDK